MNISIIIPCHNARRFLNETLESALAQSLPGTEIVAVDDGSTDGTRTLLESYGSKIVCAFLPHGGASRARNTGTRLAQGRFIQYLDSDDALVPDAVARRVQALEASGAGAAYSHWQELRETPSGGYEPSVLHSRTLESVHADPAVAVLKGFWCPPAAVLYRREAVEAAGSWDERYPVIQDARFMLDVARAGVRFIQVQYLGAFYRVREDSLSRRDDTAFLNDTFRNAADIESLWLCEGLDDARRGALAEVYAHVAQASCGRDNALFASACESLKRLVPRYRPENPRLALAARLVGYPNAVRLFSWHREARRR